MLTMSCPTQRQTGLTFIELIIFIVIVSVGIAGILLVINVTVQRSSDPLVQKQAQILAEGLLSEIQTGYFGFCDGADAQLKYAYGSGASPCAGGIDTPGVKAGEDRPYDSVIHYVSAFNVATPLPPVLPSEASLAALAGYNATVTIKPAALGDIAAAGDALLISVTVTGPNAVRAIAEGFKTRQVPQLP